MWRAGNAHIDDGSKWQFLPLQCRDKNPPERRQQTLTRTAGWKEEVVRNRTDSEPRGLKEARVWFMFDLRYPGLCSVVLGDLALLQELFRRSSFQCLRRWEAVGGVGRREGRRWGGITEGKVVVTRSQSEL